jgi:molecular chaperone GrpE
MKGARFRARLLPMNDNDDSRDDSDNTPALANSPGDTPTPVPGAAPAQPSGEQKVAALEAEKGELKDRMLRIAAEFDNYKKRVRKDMGEQEVKVREAVLRDFLEVADNLERAVASWSGDTHKDIKSVQDGVELVLRMLKSKLERYSVTPIEAKGQPFDPRVHDAISQAPSSEATPGTVLHELQKGYRVGDRLLRPSVVVVASAPPAAAQPERASSLAAGEGDANEGDESADVPGSPKGDKSS